MTGHVHLHYMAGWVRQGMIHKKPFKNDDKKAAIELKY
jgi:hypothetical protein